jgi:hypothetical protein
MPSWLRKPYRGIVRPRDVHVKKNGKTPIKIHRPVVANLLFTLMQEEDAKWNALCRHPRVGSRKMPTGKKMPNRHDKQ